MFLAPMMSFDMSWLALYKCDYYLSAHRHSVFLSVFCLSSCLCLVWRTNVYIMHCVNSILQCQYCRFIPTNYLHCLFHFLL